MVLQWYYNGMTVVLTVIFVYYQSNGTTMVLQWYDNCTYCNICVLSEQWYYNGMAIVLTNICVLSEQLYYNGMTIVLSAIFTYCKGNGTAMVLQLYDNCTSCNMCVF